MSADLRSILRLALPSARRVWGAIALGALSAACAVALLGTSAWLITYAAEQPPVLFLSMAVVGVRAFALGRAVFRYFQRLAAHDAAFRQLPAIRSSLFTRLVPLAPDGVDDSQSGDLLSRFAHDVDELQNYSLRVIQPLVTSGLIVAGSIAATFMLLPEAGIWLLVMLVLATVAGSAISSWAAGPAERRIAPLRAELTGALLDLVRNVDVLTAYGALSEAQLRVRDAGERLTGAVRTRAAGLGLTAGVVSLFAGAGTVLGLVVGIPAFDGARITGPVLAVIVLLPLTVFEIFGTVPVAFGAWRQVVVSAQRIADLAPAVVPDGLPVDAVDAAPLVVKGVPTLRLAGLCARWPGGDQPVLHDLDLELRPGERVLLTGPTGSGKTALAHVLVRFLDYEGTFSIDGVEVRGVRQDDVRKIIGLCEQQPYLFDADLRQNLLFARETATDEGLRAVLERVGLAAWADARGGVGMSMGERGALVSGGQAQRIALARALLADFPVLVVDEPTANVDAVAAARVVNDILRTAAEDGRTVVLISHTEVPGEYLTRRLVMEDGRVMEREATA